MGSDFEWYYSDIITTNERHDDEFQFCHMFYRDGKPGEKYSILKPLIRKIEPFSVISVKANLLTKTNEVRKYGFHVDVNKENLTTAVYYINTCNGFTLFRDGRKVEQVANRLVIFNAQLEHAGTSCTDEKTRVLINFK
tara:strand:- start:202 stop:615 length:414 start_codon:yes stop_codon:yes gene_type:complete